MDFQFLHRLHKRTSSIEVKDEAEARELDGQLRIASMEHSRRSQVRSDIEAITEFVKGFENEFDSAYPHEKKILMRKCVSRIIVNRDDGMLHMALRLLPAVTPEIEELYRNKTALTAEVVSAESSGDRT